MWALGGASDAGISTKSSSAIFFYLITMKKIIFLAALVAAAVPASAQIAFQSENIKFVPGDLTADNAAKVYTIDNDDNVEVYDASLNRIKSFKVNMSNHITEVKTETCSNAENVKLTDCNIDEYGEYRYWNDYNEEVVLTATSVDDMISKLYLLQGQKTFYKITINGKAGAYNKYDFYTLGEDGKVFQNRWFYSWDSVIEFDNESALTWNLEDYYMDDYYKGLESIEYYNFDNSTNSADMSFAISQTLFNDDSKWEYVVEKFGPLVIKSTDYRVDGFDDKGRMIIKRERRYESAEMGFSIMNEDGAEVGFIALPEGKFYFELYDVVVLGNKKYIRAGADDSNDNYDYLFDLDNLGSAALVVERKDNMRVVSQGDVVEIILPKNAANGEVGIVGMNGQMLGRQKVGDGQSRAKFNSANLAKGVYNATFTHKNGKRESQKFVVK